MSDEYIKPIKKSTFTVEFIHGDFKQKMELSRVPLQGEYFNNVNQTLFKITKVIYVPWNQYMADVQIEGEPA